MTPENQAEVSHRGGRERGGIWYRFGVGDFAAA